MNITYLFGAGASFNALPIVEKIPERLDVFARDFEPGALNELTPMSLINGGNLAKVMLIKLESNKNLQERYYNELKNFHRDIMWLKKESSNHSSIDTFAKKLYLKNDSNLKKLKYILSCFFLYEQTLKFDKRYDSFFASILENLSEIPSNLKIVSWNYDSQIEIAHSNFTNSSIEKTRATLNVISKGNKVVNGSSSGKFTVFKVNGTTNVSHKTDGLYDLLPDFKVSQESLIRSFLEIYSSPKQWRDHDSKMSFAWENSEEDSIFKVELMNSIRETDILIVIGYSFPFFNRKMDEHILRSMRHLKKVYVQDPFNADDIIEKIKGFFPNLGIGFTLNKRYEIEFVPKTFVDQFFIPIEF